MSLEGKTAAVSGSGNVAIYAIQKALVFMTAEDMIFVVQKRMAIAVISSCLWATMTATHEE